MSIRTELVKVKANLKATISYFTTLTFPDLQHESFLTSIFQVFTLWQTSSYWLRWLKMSSEIILWENQSITLKNWVVMIFFMGCFSLSGWKLNMMFMISNKDPIDFLLSSCTHFALVMWYIRNHERKMPRKTHQFCTSTWVL